MIFFLYGEDSFSSKAKLNAIKQRFLEKHSLDNLVVRQGAELTSINFDNIFFTQTLLGGKRLVVLEDILSDALGDIKESLTEALKSSLPDDLTVVVYESQSFDKRQKLYKLLNQPKRAQEFKPLQHAALLERAARIVREKGIQLSPALLKCILDRVENNLWALSNELDKISAFTVGKTITQEHIDALVGADVQKNVFELLDKLISSNLAAAHRILQTSLDQGEDEIRLIGAIAYQIRNLIRVFDLQAQKLSVAEIIKRTQLPPFVVRRSLDQARRIERSKLVLLYQQLVEVDHQIKTGAARPADALDLMIARQT